MVVFSKDYIVLGINLFAFLQMIKIILAVFFNTFVDS